MTATPASPAGPTAQGRVFISRAWAMALLLAAVALAGAVSAGPMLVLVTAAALVTGGTAVHATALIRLALAIHRDRRTFGPCRGAAFLGMGVLLGGATVVASGATAVTAGEAAASLVGAAGIAVTAPTYLLGLLLLPGAAPTLDARLRRLLDGAGVGISAFVTAWVLFVSPAGGLGGAPLAITLTCCITLAVAAVTGIRAVRYRPAALACAGGAALSVLGLAVVTVGLAASAAAGSQRGTISGYLAAGGLALFTGPLLAAAGARRAGHAPVEPDALDATGTLAGYPVLVVPMVAALAATAYHFAMVGSFDAITVMLGIAAVSAVALREALAARDVRRYARRLARQEAHFRTLVAGSTDVTVVVDGDLVVRWQSPAAARQFGLSDQDVFGRPFTTLLHPDDAPAVGAWLADVLGGSDPGSGPGGALVQARLRDGFGRWRETESTVSDQRGAPEVGALVIHMRDVSDRAQLQRNLDRVTWTDELTGLPNRRKLLVAIGEARRRPDAGAVLVIELDRFASINALHGNAVGDAVLAEVARRLRTGTGPADLPVRLSADAFAVLTDASAVRAYALATRLLTVLAEPYRLPGRTVHVSADIGVADLHGVGDPSAADADAVLRRADLARRRARQLGRGRVECYDVSFEGALLRRTVIEQELPGVLARGELDLAYQPILDLATRRPVGVEALLRWRHPGLGAVSPLEFLAIAAELGLVDEIGVWVLHQACRQLSRWRQDGRDLWISVNASPHEVSGDGYLAAVATALDSHCVPADSLIVEVAEAGLPADTVAVERLAGLRALGVRTAVDHFGTGPTALAHLRRLPVDVLKIDRALFSEPAGQTGPATPIVDVVVSLATRLGVEVIAAGLETESHVDIVRAAGCRYGQGFLLGQPGHAEHVEAFLEAHRAPLF